MKPLEKSGEKKLAESTVANEEQDREKKFREALKKVMSRYAAAFKKLAE